jgi:hypothetical protein
MRPLLLLPAFLLASAAVAQPPDTKPDYSDWKVQELARQVGAGTLPLPGLDRRPRPHGPDPAMTALGHAIRPLVLARTDAADRALFALANPKHPFYPVVFRALVTSHMLYYTPDPRFWLPHPFNFLVLRRGLDDTTENGREYRIEGDDLLYIDRKVVVGRGHGLPRLLADPATRKEEVKERVCDYAMSVISNSVVGVPRFDPLLRDADDRIRAAKDALDRYGRRLRSVDDPRFGVYKSFPYSMFAPEIPALGRPATAADVRDGTAVFHLDGKGEVADVKLPARVLLKQRDPANPSRYRGLAVQAEVGPDGAVVYGVILVDSIRAVPAAEIRTIEPFERRTLNVD